MKVIITGFVNTMPKPQRTAGYVYLPFHIFILPLLFNMLATYLPGGISDSTASAIYYAMGFAFCLICMWKYLRNAFDVFLDNFAKCVVALIFGYLSYILLDYVAGGIIFSILGDKILDPNNTAFLDSSRENTRTIMGVFIFAAPVVEEILFRGVVFGSLQANHRRLAFVLSIGLFALYSVWEFALAAGDWTMLVYAIAFIPAGYALAWAYEKTNTIWAPIFLHMLINGASALVISA